MENPQFGDDDYLEFVDLLDDFDPEAPIPLDRCCACLRKPVKTLVDIQTEHYPFCAGCEHRASLLSRGKKHGWPALRIDGVTGKYALGNDAQAYVLTATSGTGERVVELIDALDEYEQQQPPSAA